MSCVDKNLKEFNKLMNELDRLYNPYILIDDNKFILVINLDEIMSADIEIKKNLKNYEYKFGIETDETGREYETFYIYVNNLEDYCNFLEKSIKRMRKLVEALSW